MQKFIIPFFLSLVLVSGLLAQDTEKEKQQSKPPTKQEPSKVYWGGQLGLSFGSYFRLAIIPMVGYKVSIVPHSQKIKMR